MSKIVPLITIPDAEDCGPAMFALASDAERAWVIAKVETGCSNGDAARLAGYCADNPSLDNLKSTGYAIAHRQRIQDALLEVSRKLMRSQGPRSILTLARIRDDKAAENKDRIKAAVELLNRAGISAVQESHLTVTHQLNESQMDQRILTLAAELGLDEETARKMLIAPADLEKNANIIDADFSEVVELSDDPVNVRNRETRAYRRDMSPEELAEDKARVKAARSAALKAKYAASQPMSDDGIADLL